MTTQRIREVLSGSDMRPFFEEVARLCGLTSDQSPLDGEGRHDPFELAAEKRARAIGLKIFEWGGWSLTPTPPARVPAPQAERPVARTDGDGRDG